MHFHLGISGHFTGKGRNNWCYCLLPAKRDGWVFQGNSSRPDSSGDKFGMSIPWAMGAIGCMYVCFHVLLWALTAAWICDKGKVQRFYGILGHLAGESEVLCQNNNWLIKEISVRVSSSSDDQSDLHAGPEKLQMSPFLHCCMVNKQQLLCITRAMLLSKLCSGGTCSSPALVSAHGNPGENHRDMSVSHLFSRVGMWCDTSKNPLRCSDNNLSQRE